MIAWPETLIATPAASQDDLNLVTQYNLLLEASMELELKNTALTVRVDTLTYTGIVVSGLVVAQSPVSPDTDVDISADYVLMDDGESTASTVSVRVDLGDSGAGGLDTGVVAADTWYAIFVIDKIAPSDPDALASLALAPTMPDGFTKKRHVGWVLTDGAGDIIDFVYTPETGLWRFTPNGDDEDQPGYVALLDGLTADGGGAGYLAWGWAEMTHPDGVSHVLLRAYLEVAAAWAKLGIRSCPPGEDGSSSLFGSPRQLQYLLTAFTDGQNGETDVVLNSLGRFQATVFGVAPTADSAIALAGFYFNP